jgi:Holliday junction resolvase-like predicted endonuclease
MQRLNAVAAHYGQNRENLPPSQRIDVVAIQMEKSGKISRIELIENAVVEY